MSKVVVLYSEKKTMAHAKILWLVADIIGIPMTILGFILNIDNVKSAFIAMIVIIYLMIRLYYYVIQKKQAVRQKELELKSQSIDLWFKEQTKLKEQAKTAK
jgi:hypothetical protein